MSQKSVSYSLTADASPFKRAKFDRTQFIGPSYIRLQVMSFALSLVALPMTYIDPSNERSISRSAKEFMEVKFSKAEEKRSPHAVSE
jgi:hypothetical protein